RPARTRPLLIGGDLWVIDLARALRTAGLDVLMWGISDEERAQIKQAGLELAVGEQLTSAVAQGTDIEGVTAILLLTSEDHYNALAAMILAGNSEIPVYRLPPSQPSEAASYTPGEALFTPALTHPALTARHTAGAHITTQPSDGALHPPRHQSARRGQPQRPADPGNTPPPPRPPAGRPPRPPGRGRKRAAEITVAPGQCMLDPGPQGGQWQGPCLPRGGPRLVPSSLASPVTRGCRS